MAQPIRLQRLYHNYSHRWSAFDFLLHWQDHAARLFIACIKFAKSGNFLFSPRRLLFTHLGPLHLDYCNSFLFGVPKQQTDRLQKVLNPAARLIFRIPKFDHILSALSHLHRLTGFLWLIVFSSSWPLSFKSLKTINAHYTLKNICRHPPFLVIIYFPVTRAFLLRSQELVLRPFGDRAFACSGPLLWNKLPFEIRNSQSVAILSPSLGHICSSWLTICFNILIFLIFSYFIV